jgi:hypothetical protein
MSQRVQLFLTAVLSLFLGGLLAQRLPLVQAQESKGPKWMHGLDLRVRKGGEADFTKDTTKIGVEVFRDENTNNLIYISQTGSIAVVPGK